MADGEGKIKFSKRAEGYTSMRLSEDMVLMFLFLLRLM